MQLISWPQWGPDGAGLTANFSINLSIDPQASIFLASSFQGDPVRLDTVVINNYDNANAVSFVIGSNTFYVEPYAIRAFRRLNATQATISGNGRISVQLYNYNYGDGVLARQFNTTGPITDPNYPFAAFAAHLNGNPAIDLKHSGSNAILTNTLAFDSSDYVFGGGSFVGDGSTGSNLLMGSSSDFRLLGSWYLRFAVKFVSINTANAGQVYGRNGVTIPSINLRQTAGGVFIFASSDGNNHDIANGLTLVSSLDTTAWHWVEAGFDGSAYYFFYDGVLRQKFVSSLKLYDTTDGGGFFIQGPDAHGVNAKLNEAQLFNGVCPYTISHAVPTSAFVSQ